MLSVSPRELSAAVAVNFELAEKLFACSKLLRCPWLVKIMCLT